MKAGDEFETMLGAFGDIDRMVRETKDITPVVVPSITARSGDIEILARAMIGAISTNSQEGVDALMKTIFVLYSMGFSDGIREGMQKKEK